ncbi:hypothetical protein L1285_23230 [Pseudoalteromonas sp. DL2-H2.2]|uniref:hypothetical protein n=1 Tax=Pseudoalteromonas sp. DL2-H2.2 TaxID=2908889 RepID=UPI001F20DB85|nr:hypothetical protein [Pseudoalteromonas sp. DL2-H2.2]MCF2911215.1 hypothetical protein [Pseudoalteromonas sp. DL2-H2.2]
MKGKKYILMGVFFVAIGVSYIGIAPKKQQQQLAYNNEERVFVTAQDVAQSTADFKDFRASVSPAQSEVSKLDQEVNDLYELLKSGLQSDAMKELEFKLVTLLKSDSLTRQGKVYLLWALAKRVGLDSDEGLYVLDYLSALSPTELIGEVNGLFSSASPELQSKLLDIMESINHINGQDLELGEISKARLAVSDFLTQEIYNMSDESTKLKTMEILVSMVPFDAAKNMIEEQLSLLGRDISQQERVGLYNRLALGTPESRAEFLPNYISEIEEKGMQEVSDTLRDHLFQIVSLDEAMKNESPEFKATVSDFLASKYQEMPPEGEWGFDEFDMYNKYTVSQIKLSDNQGMEFKSVFTNAVKKEENLVKKSILLSHSSIPVDQTLVDPYSRMNLITQIESELSNYDQSDEEYAVMRSAVTILENSLMSTSES